MVPLAVIVIVVVVVATASYSNTFAPDELKTWLDKSTLGAVPYALLKVKTSVSPSAQVLANVNVPATSVDSAEIVHVPSPAVVAAMVGTVPVDLNLVMPKSISLFKF